MQNTICVANQNQTRKIDLKTSDSSWFQKQTKHIITNKMNSCMIFSALIATVVMTRILFLIGEISNLPIVSEYVPATKQLLRGMPTIMAAYERFERIHDRVLQIAITGGHIYKLNLCYKNPEITNTIETMVKESFPDSTIKSLKNGTCTAYKISW